MDMSLSSDLLPQLSSGLKSCAMLETVHQNRGQSSRRTVKSQDTVSVVSMLRQSACIMSVLLVQAVNTGSLTEVALCWQEVKGRKNMFNARACSPIASAASFANCIGVRILPRNPIVHHAFFRPEHTPGTILTVKLLPSIQIPNSYMNQERGGKTRP